MNEALKLAQRLELGASISRERGLDKDFALIADAAAAVIYKQHKEIETLKQEGSRLRMEIMNYSAFTERTIGELRVQLKKITDPEVVVTD